jgi:hypothetical protein
MRTYKKRYYFIAVVSFIIMSLNNISTFGQTTGKIDFTYTVDSLKVGNDMHYELKVTIIKGEGPFMVGVYESLKNDLVALDKKENVTFTEVKLSFTGKKVCIIYVRNQTEAALKNLIYN